MSDADRLITDPVVAVWESWGDDPPDLDGDAFDADACPACGSDNVDWSEPGWYCMHCGAVGR